MDLKPDAAFAYMKQLNRLNKTAYNFSVSLILIPFFIILNFLNKKESKVICRREFEIILLQTQSLSIKPYLVKGSHGRTGRKKVGGRKEKCPTFRDSARLVPKKFFPEKLFWRLIFGVDRILPDCPKNWGGYRPPRPPARYAYEGSLVL